MSLDLALRRSAADPGFRSIRTNWKPRAIVGRLSDQKLCPDRIDGATVAGHTWRHRLEPVFAHDCAGALVLRLQDGLSKKPFLVLDCTRRLPTLVHLTMQKAGAMAASKASRQRTFKLSARGRAFRLSMSGTMMVAPLHKHCAG